jgi:glycosyltransferase involved in cell wall biosynthesis
MGLPLTICIIARNEEKIIPRLFESIKDFAGEIIFTDTGSTDKTKEIALSYGARVYDFAWCDNFSRVRNFCISKATGEWILFLDADHIFQDESLEELKTCLGNNNIQVYSINIREAKGYVHPMPFLFRNEPGIRFSGAIHEQLEYPAHFVSGFSKIYVRHDGYSDQKILSEKLERNRQIIEKVLSSPSTDEITRLRMKIFKYIRAENLHEEIEKLYELDREIYNLDQKRIYAKCQIIELFYLTVYDTVTINIRHRIYFLLKGLGLFPTSLNLLFKFSGFIYATDPLVSIKTLNFMYFLVKTGHPSIYLFINNEQLLRKDFIISEMLSKYYFLGDYNGCLYYLNELEDQETEKIIKDVINQKISITGILSQNLKNAFTFDYIRLAREFLWLNKNPDEALNLYYRALEIAEKNADQYITALCYGDLLLNYRFLNLEINIKDIITKSKNLFNYPYLNYCLGKYFQSVNRKKTALDFFKKSLQSDEHNLALFFNFPGEKAEFLSLISRSNKISYEYFRVSAEIKALNG